MIGSYLRYGTTAVRAVALPSFLRVFRLYNWGREQRGCDLSYCRTQALIPELKQTAKKL